MVMSTRHSVAPMLVVCLLLGYGAAWTQVPHPAEAEKQEQTAEPTTTLHFTVDPEISTIHRTTADYRQQLKRLEDEARAQEKRNAQLKQDIDWLISLVEKYSSGEGIALRLSAAFERLQRARRRDRDRPIKALEAQTRRLTPQMLALDDRLHGFERQADRRLAELAGVLYAVTPEQRDADLALARKALDQQRDALHEQQQVLTDLSRVMSKLQTLHHEYTRLVDDGYHFVLTKMFLLRNAEALNWSIGQDMVSGVMVTAERLQAFGRAELGRLQASLTRVAYLWPFVLLTFFVLPWVAYWLHKRLQGLVALGLTVAAQRQVPPGVGVALLLAGQAAIWPAYLVLLAWWRGQFLPPSTTEADLLLALTDGLQVSACILWVGLLGRALLQQEGWGQRFWRLRPELCRFLRRVVTVGCLAGLLLLVPYHILLTVPGEETMAAYSRALAWFLFLAFQVVLLVLVGIVGRRDSPLMATVLARSRQEQGLLWRLWPAVHVVLLGGVVATITLHALGYLYAARYIWSKVLESLVAILVLQLLLGILVLRALHRLIGSAFHSTGHLLQRPPREQAVDRSFTIARLVWSTLLALLTVSLILQLWGVSVTGILTASLTTQILQRTVVIAVAVGFAVGMIQISNAVTESLLRSRAVGLAQTPKAGRKLRTLLPLVQTMVRIGTICLAGLVCLDQLGIAIGPFLAGLGIVGLAIGFASQSLLKDVINGLFILFEDSLSVGDVVRIRGTSGLVEKVTLRSVTLRDLSGNVHVIANSTIDMVTNMTKEYAYYVLDVSIAYHEDVNTVFHILRHIDEELRRDQVYGREILEPLEVLGLERFDTSTMILRARLKTRPTQQWRIGREFNLRFKRAFDERSMWEGHQDGVSPTSQETVAEGHPVQLSPWYDTSGLPSYI
jgi:small-conductance mechanosensitive channel